MSVCLGTGAACCRPQTQVATVLVQAAHCADPMRLVFLHDGHRTLGQLVPSRAGLQRRVIHDPQRLGHAAM
eukprot:5414911-Alexandrium_andersonii.AAC.1